MNRFIDLPGMSTMLWNLIFLLLLVNGSPGAASGYRTAAYYINWAIYARNFTPQELPASALTHVMYAFANVEPETGEIYLTDSYADTDKHFATDFSNDVGNNLYGCLKQLYLLKKQNRNLKVLLSIGGWTYSSNFAMPVSTASGRQNFASSTTSLVKNLGLDGVDINWEYPVDDYQCSNMVLLLQEVREALNAYGKSLSPAYNFLLTVACPAGPADYKKLHLADMDQYVDFWNLMAYDYAGSWSSLTGNQANIFPSTRNSSNTPFDTKTAVDYYISHRINASKIVLGMPIYGRSFEHTSGLGMPFRGVGSGTWDAGVYDYKDLPLSGAIEIYDSGTGSSYSYDSSKKELISYDNIEVANQKTNWIEELSLGGAMWWETSSDRTGNMSLIQSTASILRQTAGGIEYIPNQLFYPDTVYDNLRDGMERPCPTVSASVNPTSTNATYISISNTNSAHLLSSSSVAEVSAAPSLVLASDSECSIRLPCTGDITYYYAGLGACGQFTNGDTERVVALSSELMGTRSNNNPYCGKQITVERDGVKIVATVVDKCTACSDFSVDLSTKAFADLGIDFSVGRTNGSWYFNN